MNITTNKQGDKVQLIILRNTYTHIPPGTQGTVDFVDGIGTVHVTWDNGSHLGLVPGVDKWNTLIHQCCPGGANVSSKELGTNCWTPCRFIKDDGRCDRVFTCKYPEKKTCHAIQAEIEYLNKDKYKLANQIIQRDLTIEMLQKTLKK